MEIKINISEDEIKDIVLQEIASQYHSAYSGDRNFAKRVVAECVREIIYKDKEHIVDMIVAQASRECRNKALKKILDNLESED